MNQIGTILVTMMISSRISAAQSTGLVAARTRGRNVRRQICIH